MDHQEKKELEVSDGIESISWLMKQYNNIPPPCITCPTDFKNFGSAGMNLLRMLKYGWS